MAKFSNHDTLAIEEVKNEKLNKLHNSFISRYVLRMMKKWKKCEFFDDYLWGAFQDNFENFTEKKFNFANRNNQRKLKLFFRRRGVWIFMTSKLSFAEVFMNLLNELEFTVWIDAEIKNFMKMNGFTSFQMQHDLAILIEEWVNKKLQTFQQKNRRRISFFSINSPDQSHDRRQRQSTF